MRGKRMTEKGSGGESEIEGRWGGRVRMYE